MKSPFFVTLILSMTVVTFGADLTTLFEWKSVDYVWYSSQQKEEAIKSGDYNVSKCVLFDVDEAEDGRVFVTSEREKGVPASLMTVSDQEGEGGPLLRPYPDWSWYTTDNCSSIISVYRVAIKCNRLFVLDCGQIGDETICPPKLLIFDLSNDKLIKVVIIPNDVSTNANGTGLLVTPAVFAKRGCKNIENTATVFLADIEGYGLVTYDAEISTFYRFESDSMKPTDTTFTIENKSFLLDDGILGLTVINKDLYFSVLAGNSMYKIDVNKLKGPLKGSKTNDPTQLVGTLSGQTAAIASKQCTLFFSDIPKTAIMCANACQKFNSSNTYVIVQDSEKLQFVSGVKVKKMKVKGKEKLMCMTNRFQRVMTDTLYTNETNFRIVTINMDKIQEEAPDCFSSCKSSQGKYMEYDMCCCKNKCRKNPWTNWSNYGPHHGGPHHGGPYYDGPHYDGPHQCGPHHDKPDHDKPDHDKPDHDKPGHGGPDHDKPDHDKPDHDKPDHGGPHHGGPYYDGLHQCGLHHDKPDHDKPDHDKPDHDKPDHDKPDHDKPDHDKPDHDGPDHDKSDHDKSDHDG